MIHVVLTTLNFYTLSMFFFPVAAVSAFLKNSMVFMVLAEVILVVGSILNFYSLWWPVVFSPFVGLSVFEYTRRGIHA